MGIIKRHRKSLQLGMTAQALDGEVGEISKLITDPESRQPSYLAVKIGRLRSRREVVVPVSMVSSVDADTVSLNLTRKALADFPAYEIRVPVGRYEAPVPVGRRPKEVYTPPSNAGYLLLRQRSVPEKSVAVQKGMLVTDSGRQEVGKVEGLILDAETRQGKYLVFRRDRFSTAQRIPVGLIEDVSSTEVKLLVDRKFVENLPEYNGA